MTSSSLMHVRSTSNGGSGGGEGGGNLHQTINIPPAISSGGGGGASSGAGNSSNSSANSSSNTMIRRNSLITAAAATFSRGGHNHHSHSHHSHQNQNQGADETILSTNASEHQFHASTSESLAHCSSTILVHYNRLATVIGWRAVIDARSSKHCLPLMVATINYLYLSIVILLLLSGYVLQYATCFRQDNLDAYDPMIIDHQQRAMNTTPKLGSSLVPQNFTTLTSTAAAASSAITRAVVNSTGKEDLFFTPELPLITTVVQQSTKAVYPNSHLKHHHRHILRKAQPMNSEEEETVSPPFQVVPAHFQLLNSTRSLGARALERIGDSIRALRDRLTSRNSNISYHNSRDLHHHHETLLQCRGGTGTYYVIPALLHFSAYLAMLYLMRSPEEDRFHNLVVVTYLLMTKTVGRDKASARLKRIVRGWLLFGALTLTLTTVTHILHLYLLPMTGAADQQPLCFTFLQPSEDSVETALTAACLLAFSLLDFICIAIYTTYALHCELNVHFLNTNVTAMREKRINFREFTKNTEDSKTNLDYLNSRHSIGVSILLVHFVSRLLVVVIECLFGSTSSSSSSSGFSDTSAVVSRSVQHSLLSGLAVAFWLLLLLMVLVQAARVTFACKSVRHIGHELRSRPFCYQSAPYTDLDSLLNYTSTLHMSARLMLVPVRASCVATISLTAVVLFLVLGQVNVIQF